MSIKICIDAGHGGRDPGAVNGSYEESKGTLLVADWLKNLLLAIPDFKVRMTRKDDTYISLSERCRISNEFNADAFISIHFNSAENTSATGIETLRYSSVGNTTKKLANNVQKSLIETLHWKDRGVKTRDDLTVLKKTKAPAILVECGFISNIKECALLFDCYHQYLLASAIVKGIEKTFK